MRYFKKKKSKIVSRKNVSSNPAVALDGRGCILVFCHDRCKPRSSAVWWWNFARADRSVAVCSAISTMPFILWNCGRTSRRRGSKFRQSAAPAVVSLHRYTSDRGASWCQEMNCSCVSRVVCGVLCLADSRTDRRTVRSLSYHTRASSLRALSQSHQT